MQNLIDELFESIIQKLFDENYITMGNYFLDGTKIEAKKIEAKNIFLCQFFNSTTGINFLCIFRFLGMIGDSASAFIISKELLIRYRSTISSTTRAGWFSGNSPSMS